MPQKILKAFSISKVRLADKVICGLSGSDTLFKRASGEIDNVRFQDLGPTAFGSRARVKAENRSC